MKRTTLYSFLAIALILNSCKKKDLPPKEEESSPVFYFKGNVNGVPVRIDAGINDYYMSASHYRDANNVFVYKAELRQASCTANCGYALSVLINDAKFSTVYTGINVDSGLALGKHNFNDGSNAPRYYTGSFKPRTISIGTQYEWHFSDGTVYYNANTSKQLEADKTYTVVLYTNDPQGCITSHKSIFKAGNPVQANISASYQSGKFYFSVDSPSGKPPYNYLWEFGDGATSTSPNPDHAFQQQNSTTRLTLTDATGASCTSYFQINGDNSCESNFKGSLAPVPNTAALSAITVLVTDQNGNTYSSSSLPQPQDSKFEIVSVEEYKTNERNDRTRKLLIRFNCSLTSSAGPVNITDGEAVIAVSYQ